MNYEKSIDGLRGLAILLVIMFHTHVVHFGWAGVILFFVLSGYLITKVLWLEKEKEAPVKIKFRNFWMRRILRIFPLYYLYLFILIILLLTKLISIRVAFEMPWLITYTYNFYLINVYDTHDPSFLAGHLWTLAIEEQFYLFYPFLVFLFNRRQLKVAIIWLIFFSILFRIFFSMYHSGYSGNSYGYLGYHTLAYMDSFLFGAAIFAFRLDKLSPGKGYIILFCAGLATLIGGLFIYFDINNSFHLLNFLASFGIEGGYIKYFYRVWGLLNLNLLFSSLLILLLIPVKNKIHLLIRRIFETRFFVSIGKVSYGMYIFHAVIIWVLLSIFDPNINLFTKYIFCFISILATWALSLVIYDLFEKRFLMLKEKFR